MSTVVYTTRDDEREAHRLAEQLWDRRRKALVMRVLDWNQQHPERLLRTADRFVVIAERQQ